MRCLIICGGFITIKENRFSSSGNNINNKRVRYVVVNNNIQNYNQFESDTNVNVKEIDNNSLDSKNFDEQNKKSMNDTLDIKIDN